MLVLASGCVTSPETHEVTIETPADNSSEIIWQQIFPWGGWWDEGKSIVRTGDDGFAIAGSISVAPDGLPHDNGNDRVTMLLLRVDENGCEIWNKTYDEWYGGYSLVQTRDGGFAMMGYYGTDGARLVRVDASGNLLWDRPTNQTNDDDTCALVETDDGGFIYTGSVRQSRNYTVLAARTDPDGTILWSHTYRPGAGSSIAVTQDGGYVIAGSTVSGNPDEMFVIRIDSAGNTLWTSSYDYRTINISPESSPDLDIYYETVSILPAEDGGYILSGTVRSPHDYLSADQSANNNTLSGSWGEQVRPFVLKMDPTGNISWVRTYGAEGMCSKARALVPTNDDGYAFVGVHAIKIPGDRQLSGNPYDYGYFPVRLTKIDAGGKEIYHREYRFADWNLVDAMVQARDGGFVIAGTTLPENATTTNYDLLIMKVPDAYSVN